MKRLLGSSVAPVNPVARDQGGHWWWSETVMGIHLAMGYFSFIKNIYIFRYKLTACHRC